MIGKKEYFIFTHTQRIKWVNVQKRLKGNWEKKRLLNVAYQAVPTETNSSLRQEKYHSLKSGILLT